MANKSKGINGGEAMENLETVFAAGSDAMKQNMEKALKGLDDVTSFNKSTVDALVKSANAASKGFEALSAEVLSYSKQSVEDAMAAAKAAMGSRSVQEFIEINTDFAKSAFDTYVGRVTKLGDMATTTAKDTFEPINNRVSALIEVVQTGRGA
jgi:phasin family protein